MSSDKPPLAPRPDTHQSQAGAGPGDTRYCSFCGKSEHEVRKLVAGPSVFICDECTDICHTLVHAADALSGWESDGTAPAAAVAKLANSRKMSAVAKQGHAVTTEVLTVLAHHYRPLGLSCEAAIWKILTTHNFQIESLTLIPELKTGTIKITCGGKLLAQVQAVQLRRYWSKAKDP